MEIPKLSTFVASKAAVRIMYICNRRVGGMILVWCEDGIEWSATARETRAVRE